MIFGLGQFTIIITIKKRRETMANMSDYLSQLQKLTKQNLEILQAINNSFFTKREHLTVTVGSANYAIPSFICLENKINALQEAFDNLVYAPKTGEATFNFDGNSKSIEVRGYTHTPNRLELNIPDHFSVEQNDIFKDFMTPNPFLRFDLQSLPNDITTVNVRKVAFKSNELRSIIAEKIGGSQSVSPIIGYEWASLYKLLSIYTEDQDYVMYDTIRQLPIRKNIGSGTYVIKSVDKDEIDENLEEFVTITFWDDLKYTLFDETIQRTLQVGDELVTFDDSAKMKIVAINTAARQVTVKILNGDYLNLVADTVGPNAEGVNENVSDLSKLKFFSPVDYNVDKYIDVPLEEDQYIAIFVAPLNSRMNVQAPWGRGIIADTDNIKLDKTTTTFRNFYNENVRNVGDILFEISSIMSNTIMQYSKDEFEEFSQYKPSLNPDHIQVVQINTHLNNSPTVKNIRALYSQKKDYISQLAELQEKMSEINAALAELSLTDTTGVRTAYESELSQYNVRKNELVTSLTKVTDEISKAASDSTIPLENAKYHIRGYYNWYITDPKKDAILSKYWKHVRGIKVQYRYKNQDSATGTARHIGSDGFIYSDWNDMYSPILQRNPQYVDGYRFTYPQYADDQNNQSHCNDKLNEPSFNQIDIPISQGETVDIRLKIVWDFGAPFIESLSDWSDVMNVVFPEEYTKDVQLLDILHENNDDIETNRFQNILKDGGVTSHVDDKLVDQDLVYFHKPENIASGFYTNERRVIPLRDKLSELDQSVIALQDIVNGTNSDSFQVSVIVNNVENIIYPGKENIISMPAFSDAEKKNGVASYQATIQIANISNRTAYLYSMFPGPRGTIINDLIHTKFDKNEYSSLFGSDPIGIWMGHSETSTKVSNQTTTITTENIFKLQTAGQWITFRWKNPYDGQEYYDDGEVTNPANWALPTMQMRFRTTSDKYTASDPYTTFQSQSNSDGMLIYPYLSEEDALIIGGDPVYSKKVLAPGESLIVPIMVHYRLNNSASGCSKHICFDLRPSLYSDPTNYLIKITAANTDTVSEKVSKAERARLINRVDVETGVSQLDRKTQLSGARYKTVIKNQ